jgi:hypothetical protein
MADLMGRVARAVRRAVARLTGRRLHRRDGWPISVGYRVNDRRGSFQVRTTRSRHARA